MTKKIKTMLYKNHTILAFEKDQILKLFGTDQIEFECTIVNDRLILTGPTIRIGPSIKLTSQNEGFTYV